MNPVYFQTLRSKIPSFMADIFVCFFGIMVFWGGAAYEVFGAEFSVYSRAGLFQQPSSQYYHFTQGIGAKFLFFEERFGAEFTYDQRPKFRSQGYEDQDEFTTFSIGGRFKKYRNFRLGSYIGISKIYGYIRALNQDEFVEKRDYEMHAASLSMQIEYAVKYFFASFGVQNFHGFSTREQSEIYVAWPFYGFVLSLGASI